MNDNDINREHTAQSAIDSEWIEAIRLGDENSFKKLFDLYCQQLINYSRNYVTDKQIAENIVQDVFVSLWQNRTKLDPSKMIKAYLFTSVKNNSLKYLRHLKIENKGIEGSKAYIIDDESPDRKLDGKELELKIHQAVNELPEKCMAIFKMNRFENLKYAEIALNLDISIKTVETQMGRALKKLRERLKPYLTILLIVFATVLILTI